MSWDVDTCDIDDEGFGIKGRYFSECFLSFHEGARVNYTDLD